MVLRSAALGLAIGLGAQFGFGGPAMAEITVDGEAEWATDQTDAAAQTTDQTPGAICLRGARADALNISDLIQLESSRFEAAVYQRYLEDAETVWASVMAEASAGLPEAARDLPILVLLAANEQSSDPILSLLFSPKSSLMPQILEVVNRQGLTGEARALRLAMVTFPDWDIGFVARLEVYAAQGSSDAALQATTIRAVVDAASRLYPRGGAEAAIAGMIQNDPTLRNGLTAGISQQNDEQLLYWLVQRLWADCAIDWSAPAATQRSFAAIGSPQTALILMDSLLVEISEGTAEYYFTGQSATMAPELARVLELRGLTAHADAIRTGIALFPTPYPRDPKDRLNAFNRFADDQRNQLTALAEVLLDDAIWSEMQRLAREAGLLPAR